MIVITAQDALYYAQACTAFEQAGVEGFSTLEEVKITYKGLTRTNACEWAIYGMTVQGWLNFEGQLNTLASYTDALRARILYLEQSIADLQMAAQKQQDSIQQE